MADLAPTQRTPRTTSTPSANNGSPILRKLQALIAPNSSQRLGVLTFIITGSILLLLTGITVTWAVLGLIFVTPLIIISSPIWIPVAIFFFFVVACFSTFCGLGLAVVAGLSWMYRYYRGLSPLGSDHVDYARNRIYDTASHVKDYAREYGGYLQSKVKDAAPGA